MSLVHRATGRKALAGPGNIFETYDDRPTAHDAWDVDPYHLETRKPAAPAHSARVVRTDPLRAEIEFDYRIGSKSTLIASRPPRCRRSKRLEFHCDIDWQESQTMLKVAFPINARSMNATYEMQFGYVERPTHYNTSFDLAKYEVPLHKWFDFGEHGFGCAILSESKYGGSTFDNTMRLSLLRSPSSPDPKADRGRQQFAFAILPHAGGWRDAGVVGEAAIFNAPLRAIGGAVIEPIVSCDDANLVVDTVKRAEDSDALIVRLYECHGARGTARLTVSPTITKATLCNVLEDDSKSLPITAGVIEVQYAPHKVLTLKLL